MNNPPCIHSDGIGQRATYDARLNMSKTIYDELFYYVSSSSLKIANGSAHTIKPKQGYAVLFFFLQP